MTALPRAGADRAAPEPAGLGAREDLAAAVRRLAVLSVTTLGGDEEPGP